MATVLTPNPPVPQRYYPRHARLVRLTHWITAFCFMLLLMSGLQIFNAHPALYVGNSSDFGHPLLSLHPFPSWITLPSYQDLATGRRWHFFFAWALVVNGLVYLIWGFASSHFRRDLLPRRVELRHIGREVVEHLRLRFPRGEAARRYNVLQQPDELASSPSSSVPRHDSGVWSASQGRRRSIGVAQECIRGGQDVESHDLRRDEPAGRRVRRCRAHPRGPLIPQARRREIC